tara:strand:- start:1431 stop:2348 length:918 start_codon:yes stop_codon:yes gene_type:complete
MTNEDQKNQNEEMNEDNLMAELDEFNSGSSQEAEEQPVEEQQADSQKAEEVQENQSDEKSDKEIPEEKNTEIEQWLIKNKFADDEEGKQKLVDAYRQLQSKSDKERNEWGSEKQKYEKLAQLDDFLASNPDVVQKLTESVQEKQKDLNAAPVKPDDYDILDESIENSSSAKWREKHDKWLINQGATQAMLEVEKLKSELSESQAFDAETAELQKMGLSDTEVVEYRQFMADPNNVSQENLVQIWKTLSNKGNSPEQNLSKQTPKVKNKQNSAAAISGNAPQAVEPEEKVVDDFWKGIMEFNNTNT